MRTFDTIRFLEDYGIDYVTSGKSVSRRFAGVQCPFCQDTGHHLGINKTTGYSTCWLCGPHTTYDTIKALTGENPKEVVERYGILLYSTQVEYTPTVRPKKIDVPGRKKFRQIHYEYLNNRGFDSEYILHKYDVRATYAPDPLPFRLVFPVTYNKKIVSYQGRTIVDAVPKYITCKPELEVMFHKDTFFNIDNCNKESVLVVEGVFDAIRFGDNAIASFGTSITPSQLNVLRSRFDKVFFLYDSEPEAQKKARTALTTLNSCGIVTENIELDSGDPGDLTDEDAMYLKRDLDLI